MQPRRGTVGAAIVKPGWYRVYASNGWGVAPVLAAARHADQNHRDCPCTCCGVSRPLQITEVESDTGQDHCMTQNVIEAGLTRNRHGKHGDISSSPGPNWIFRECGVFDVYRRKGLYANKYTSESTEYS